MSGPINPSVLTWDAPQINVDGTPLIDLKEYRVVISASAAGPWVQVATVAAPSPDPAAGAVAASAVNTWGPLAAGQYFASVRAADLTGNVSTEAVPIPFVSADMAAPATPANLRFS